MIPCYFLRIFRLLFSLVLICLLSLAGRAQSTRLVVTQLGADRPGVLGRFATVAGTFQNTGAQPITLRGLFVMAQLGQAAPERSKVGPLTPALPLTLRPGQRIQLRRFVKVPQAGTYHCVFEVETGQGVSVVNGPQGKSASVALNVLPAALVPQASFTVSDPQPKHVYRAGQTIQVQITPFVFTGADLSGEVQSLTVTPAAKPFSMTDPAQARALMLGTDGKQGDFNADFFGVPDADKYLTVEIAFQKPSQVSTLRVTGFNPNGEYGLSAWDVSALQPNGGAVPLPAQKLQDGNGWTLLVGQRRSVTATGLRLRLHTHYKIQITGLTLQGQPATEQTQTNDAALTCRWTDAFGKPLTAPHPLTAFQANAVASPPHLAPGYYGLTVTTQLPEADEARREYGFVVLPTDAKQTPDTRFGMVHPDLNDAHLGIAWTKTLTTPFYNAETQTLDAAGWEDAVGYRQARGLTELPIVIGGEWDSDNTKPVSAEQLQKLQTKMRQYFAADPTALYWELGLEENLGYRAHRDKWPYYWPNLEAKARAVRDAAQAVNPKIKLIFQIAEIDPKSLDQFLASDAAKQFDILALHPYAWPDFRAPESWMPKYLAQAHALMKKYGEDKPIWFTEIGAPINGNPGGFFGYPGSAVFDRGLDRDEYMAYLVRCHLVALQNHVEKIFWYTYQDGGQSPEYAEDHFGLIDFRGYPKPGYAAYVTMTRLLNGKALVSTAQLAGGLHLARFRGAQEDCLVVWTYPEAAKTVKLSQFGLTPARVKSVTDITGKAVSVKGNTLPVSGYPVYVTVRH